MEGIDVKNKNKIYVNLTKEELIECIANQQKKSMIVKGTFCTAIDFG